MENVLAKTRQAVSRYKSRSQSDNLNATKSVWAAVRFLRKQLPELERQDRGVTTRIARELSDLLSKLPMFRYLKEDKDASENLYSKPQAEELILKLENQLKTLVKDLENSKIDEIRGWVENHAVLGTLTKTLTRKMPDSTYVFLFRQTKGGSIELVTSRSPDGRVFTRFRPREFFDVKKLYRLYNHRPPVGAAVVVDNKLQDVIGTVPQPNEGEDQLHVISALSKEAASQPAKVFLSGNPVLQTLHGLVKERKVDKSAYILLFVDAHEEIDFDADLDDELAASEEAPAEDEHGSGSESSGDAGQNEEAPADEQSSEDVDTSANVDAGMSEEISSSAEVPPSEEPAASVEVPPSEEPAASLEVPPPSEELAASVEVPPGEEPAASAEVPPSEEPAASLEVPSSEEPAASAEVPPSEEPAASVEPPPSEEPATSAEVPATEGVACDVETIASDESASNSEEQTIEASEHPEQSAAKFASIDAIGSIARDAHNEENSEAGAEPAAVDQVEPGESDTTGDASSESSSEEQSPAESKSEPETPAEEQVYTPVEILTRSGNDGGVLTRYYGNEFSDVRKVFETFSMQRTIAGAAVVRGRELIQVIGNVPQPQGRQSQLDVLLSESNHAADKPTRDFLVENEILNSLHELASGDFPDPNARVLLFVEEEGRLAAMVPPPPVPQREERGRGGDRNRGGDRDRGDRNRGRDDRDRGGRDRGRDDRGRDDRDRGGSTKTSMLSDFRYPRDIRNNYKSRPRVVGASVIGEFKAPQPQRKEPATSDARGGPSSRDDKRGRDDRGRRDQRPASKSVVLAAFGRTPLKMNILITEETTRRLGLDFFV